MDLASEDKDLHNLVLRMIKFVHILKPGHEINILSLFETYIILLKSYDEVTVQCSLLQVCRS